MPLDKLPLFIKRKIRFCLGKIEESLSSKPDEKMIFRVFGEYGNYTHYQDNGADFAYKNG